MSDECRFYEESHACRTHSEQGGSAALCTHAAAALRAELVESMKVATRLVNEARAERDKYRRYPFEPICLNCGALEPCMAEADLKPGDPGIPCTFDPTPRQLFDQNAALRAKVAVLGGELQDRTQVLEELTRRYGAEHFSDIVSAIEARVRELCLIMAFHMEDDARHASIERDFEF